MKFVIKRAKLGDVVDVNPPLPKKPTPREIVSVVPMASVGAGTNSIEFSQRRPASDVKSGLRPFMENDVLLAKITPSMENGKAAVVHGLPTKVAFGSTEFHVLRCSDSLRPKYIYYFVSQASFRGEARRNMTGTAGQLRVPARWLRDVEIEVPSLAAQDATVAEIEKHFTRLDAGMGLLSRVGIASRLFRAGLLESLLRDATSFADPSCQEVSLGDLWVEAGYGTSVKCSYQNAGTSVLRIPNIRGGQLDLADLKRADSTTDLTKLKLKTNDLLIIRTNGSKGLIGRTAPVREDLDAAFASYLIRLRLNPEMVGAPFVSALLESPTLRRRMQQLAGSTSGQYNISLSKLKTLTVPVPALPRQREMMRLLERRASLGDAIEIQGKWAREKSEVLRQSVLARAFSGELISGLAA